MSYDHRSLMKAVGLIVVVILTFKVAPYVLWGIYQKVWLVTAYSKGRVMARGQVVDEAGKPMTDVRMRVHAVGLYTRLTGTGDSKKVLEDGTFELSCHFCTGFQVSFSKAGYSTARHTWLISLDSRDDRRLIVDDAEVVLERDPPETIRIEGTLRVDAGGARTVVVLSDVDPGPRLLTSHQEVDSLMMPAVYLVAATSPDGKLLQHQVIIRGAALTEPAPSGIWFVFPGADDGLVGHRATAKDIKRGERLLEEMDWAISSTFRNSIELDEPTAYSAAQPRYFYCRAGGLFGKGMVSAPRFESSDGIDVVAADLIVHLNITGSRYLATADMPSASPP